MVFIGYRFSLRKIFNHNVKNFYAPTCFLFDNGSLRPAATLGLRRVADRLANLTGVEVRAVSLLHSDRVDQDSLGGRPAELLEPALDAFVAGGGRQAVALPLFFGPSGAMVDYLPPRIEALESRHPGSRIRLAACLESPDDDSPRLLATALKQAIFRMDESQTLRNPTVIVTDHGSPLPTVTAVRNRIGTALARIKDPSWPEVKVASMERREGRAYDFNEPLLARALRETAASGHSEMVVAQQFLFPGRHAGPGGDIAEICAEFERENPACSVLTTEPIGESDEVLALLARRLQEAL